MDGLEYVVGQMRAPRILVDAQLSDDAIFHRTCRGTREAPIIFAYSNIHSSEIEKVLDGDIGAAFYEQPRRLYVVFLEIVNFGRQYVQGGLARARLDGIWIGASIEKQSNAGYIILFGGVAIKYDCLNGILPFRAYAIRVHTWTLQKHANFYERIIVVDAG